jgi:hypothetical protein
VGVEERRREGQRSGKKKMEEFVIKKNNIAQMKTQERREKKIAFLSVVNATKIAQYSALH